MIYQIVPIDHRKIQQKFPSFGHLTLQLASVAKRSEYFDFEIEVGRTIFGENLVHWKRLGIHHPNFLERFMAPRKIWVQVKPSVFILRYPVVILDGLEETVLICVPKNDYFLSRKVVWRVLDMDFYSYFLREILVEITIGSGLLVFNNSINIIPYLSVYSAIIFGRWWLNFIF